jgi:hypothetical protein
LVKYVVEIVEPFRPLVKFVVPLIVPPVKLVSILGLRYVTKSVKSVRTVVLSITTGIIEFGVNIPTANSLIFYLTFSLL